MKTRKNHIKNFIEYYIMVTHFIFMSSSYSLGTRIILDFIVEEASIQEELKKV